MKPPPLVKSLQLQLKDVPAAVRKASMIVLASELGHLQQKLGYKGEGSWQAHRAEVCAGERLTWANFCKQHGGITETSVRNFVRCGLVVIERLRVCPSPERAELIGMMEKPPSTLTAAQRKGLIEAIVRLVITSAEDWQSIWNKAKALGRPTPAEGKPGDSSAPPQPGEDVLAIEKLALEVGVSAENTGRIATLLADSKLQRRLVETWSQQPLMRPRKASKRRERRMLKKLRRGQF
jgi:hypothetical protein